MLRRATAPRSSRASTDFGLPPAIIVALGSRESRWGLALDPDGPGRHQRSHAATLAAARTGRCRCRRTARASAAG